MRKPVFITPPLPPQNIVFGGYTVRDSVIPSFCDHFLAHLSRRLRGELIVYQSIRRPSVRPSVRPCVCALTLSNMNISVTHRRIGMRFYLKHHWGGGKASVGFDLDLIRTLVSMATDSSHRVIMGKTTSSHFLEYF